MMRIAIVGTGIAGMTAAHLLHREHDIAVLEASGWIGGHAHAVDVTMDDGTHALDTGFLVYNEPGYPILTRMFRELGVLTQETEMSFSVSCEETGLEYNGTSVNALFAQRRNIFRPSFHRMILDILRFYREARRLLLPDADEPGPTLGEFLERGRYSRAFVDQHLVPMSSAIWSGDRERMLDFPAKYLARFFDNHGFLQATNRVGWRSVVGSSREYVSRLTEPWRDRIRLGSEVRAVRRTERGVEVSTDAGTERFDHVVLAGHADDSLAVLKDASPLERELLLAFPYQANRVVLHHDERLLPRLKRARAAWNYHLRCGAPEEGALITYYLNALQRLRSKHDFCVTLNREEAIRPERILGRWVYRHPIYTAQAFAAQRRLHEIDGVNRVSFCGAWRGWGFHEDGARSAVECVARLRELASRQPPQLQAPGMSAS